jgi:hypothetical protein
MKMNRKSEKSWMPVLVKGVCSVVLFLWVATCSAETPTEAAQGKISTAKSSAKTTAQENNAVAKAIQNYAHSVDSSLTSEQQSCLEQSCESCGFLPMVRTCVVGCYKQSSSCYS